MRDDTTRVNLTALIVGGMFIAIGTLFLLDEYDVLTVDGFFVLPIMIIGLGIAVILGGRR
jgi:hypothetical protein